MTSHGNFHWNELKTKDIEQAKKFYADTIGWTFAGMDMGENGTYWIAMDGEKPVAGMYAMIEDQIQNDTEGWTGYISVDDIDMRIAKAKQAGATVIAEPFDIPGTGRIAILVEPGGARIGWMTPSEDG